MAIDTPTPTVPNTGQDVWASEAELPEKRRAGSSVEEIRAKLRTNEGKFLRIAHETTNSTSFYRAHLADDYEVRTFNLGKRDVKLKRDGKDGPAGTLVTRNVFDVWVRYQRGFKPQRRQRKPDNANKAAKS